MKILLTLAAAATLTVLLSPTLRNAALRLLFVRDFPLTPYGFEPKYAIGGRYVTRAEFDQHAAGGAA